MKTQIVKPQNTNSKVIITGFFEDEKSLSNVQAELNKKFLGVIENNINKNFEGKFNETLIFPLENGVKIIALGLGKKEELTLNKLREAVSKAISGAKKYIKEGILSVEFIENDNICKKGAAYNTVIAAGIADYKFDKYKTKKDEKIENLEILTNDDDEKIIEGIKKGDILNNAMNFTKDMVFESAEIMTPSKVAEIAKNLADEYKIEAEIFDKNKLKELNFNAFLAVGQGSAQEPKFIRLAYKPENPKKKIVLIGKGITFDSGGLDIKPPSSMLTMKTDMTGCATVLGVMKAICEIKPDVEVHIMSALCENMPSGSSYKVGDVITSKSGKTIEVDNTDAEGRLTLADVLTYADEFNPDEVIDIATLTGAVIVALGNNITGIMGNNQEMIDNFKKTAEKIGEPVWQLPIYEDMMDGLKSDIADMKNTGPRGAGSSVAGRFLQNYTKSKNWLHIDIAGSAYIDKPYRELQKGATGVMVRTLTEYIIK